MPDVAVPLLFAFLSGTILVNVMKEELPHQKEISVWAFFLGAALYTLLLYLIDRRGSIRRNRRRRRCGLGTANSGSPLRSRGG